MMNLKAIVSCLRTNKGMMYELLREVWLLEAASNSSQRKTLIQLISVWYFLIEKSKNMVDILYVNL